MILNERKLKILQAIITDYIATAEPIGSRTISKKYDIGLSSATIRNEMKDLEELGLIIQPHTSSGRIPSDKGYRLYVDNLMYQISLPKEETDYIHGMIEKNIENIDYLMQETAKAISYLTNYTAIISEPRIKKMIIKHIQLVPYDSTSILMVLISDSKVVKNFSIKTFDNFDYNALSNMSLILNHLFSGKTDIDINLDDIKSFLFSLGSEGEALLKIIDPIIFNILKEKDIDIYTTGVKNILTFPEFSNLDKAQSVFEALEEKEILITLLDKGKEENIKIVIGNENTIEQMKDCSIIKAGFQINDNFFGSVGIIGPTRMNYSQVISVLYNIQKNLNRALNNINNDP